ncbi:MAG: peroxiredoxin [Anaerolineaceae bacterium]|nr:peroxiredoxin [Anaerolineaceae bacterium]
MNELKVGSTAPDFCTLEAKNFTEEEQDFSDLFVPVIGISPDPPKSHMKFIEKQGLKVHLLSDTSHEVLGKYGAWTMKKMYGKEYMGVERSTFIIDPQGTIAALWRKVKVKGHVDEVKSRLNGLIMRK